MQRTNISLPYGVPSSGTPITTACPPPSMITNVGNTNINTTANLINANYMIPSNNIMPNSNCFPRPISNISQPNNHANNL